MENPGFQQTSRNKVNRLRNRANYDFATVHEIVNNTSVLHVSFIPDPSDPFPIVLPMIGQMGSFPNSSSTNLNQPLDLYLHGSIGSRIMKLCQEAKARGEEGLPICTGATKVDGLVLALTPFHHSYNFRSAVLHGYGQVVEDPEEKLYALDLITNKVVPERWQNTRTPPNKVEMQSTHILRVRVSSGSAKLRWGVPNADRGDLKNAEVVNNYWSGVIPVWEAFGNPIAGPQNATSLPEHISSYVNSANGLNRRVAFQAAEEQDK